MTIHSRDVDPSSRAREPLRRNADDLAGRRASPLLQPALHIGMVMLLGFFFANVEIQIEGPHGWASSLPTWRVEHHWLLDIFWGSRPMTGYHAWVFPFMALFFHFPLVFAWRWSLKLEARVIASIMMFWLTEDFLWFALNPAYGLAKFSPENIPWHIHWFWFAPVDYWTMSLAAVVLMGWSYWKGKTPL